MSDADTKELAKYFSGKSSEVVAMDLEHLDKVIERARGLSETLSSNSLLSWRCAIDRCLARKGNRSVKLCRACTANEAASKLLRQLLELSAERHEAAQLADEIQRKQDLRDALQRSSGEPGEP